MYELLEEWVIYMPTLQLEKANPFKAAWEWLQNKIDNRAGLKTLEQDSKERKRRVYQNPSPRLDEPLTPEQITSIQSYIQQTLLPQEPVEETNQEY